MAQKDIGNLVRSWSSNPGARFEHPWEGRSDTVKCTGATTLVVPTGYAVCYEAYGSGSAKRGNIGFRDTKRQITGSSILIQVNATNGVRS